MRAARSDISDVRMKYIFLIGAFNALFFAVLILQKKKAAHDKILIYWLIYLGIYIGTYALFSGTLFRDFPLLSASFISFFMLQGPFLYLYISALINEKFTFQWNSLLHFIPFLLFNLYLLIASWFPEMAGGIRLDHVSGGHKTPALFDLFLILTALSGPVYIILSARLFKKFDINILDNFSTAENVNPAWLRNLVYSFGAIWTILIVFATVHHIFHLFSWIFCTDGLFLSLSVFVILVGYFGLTQKRIYTSHPGKNTGYVTTPKAKYAGTPLDETDAQQYTNRIKHYMRTKKPYLDPNLTLPDLADKLQMSSHILSRVINEKFGVNFFDFINQYRIQEVKVKMADPEYDHLSLLGIAMDSGFNTKSAFNRVFKKHSGLTPSEYKKTL